MASSAGDENCPLTCTKTKGDFGPEQCDAITNHIRARSVYGPGLSVVYEYVAAVAFMAFGAILATIVLGEATNGDSAMMQCNAHTDTLLGNSMYCIHSAAVSPTDQRSTMDNSDSGKR